MPSPLDDPSVAAVTPIPSPKARNAEPIQMVRSQSAPLGFLIRI